MPEENDVKESTDSSTEEKSEEKELDEELEKLNDEESASEESKDDAEKAETKDADVKDDSESSDESKEEEGETEEEESKEALKQRLEKAEEVAENLKKALQEKRKSSRESISSVPSQQGQAQNVAIDTDAYVRSQIAAVEGEALDEMYKKWPGISPENDPDNAKYDAFRKEFAVAARVMGVIPTTKNQFMEIGERVMTYRFGAKPDVEKVKADARADARKQALKAEAADIGGTSVASKETPQQRATPADIRAAKAAGMSLKGYLKNKDLYDDGIPI